MAKRDYYEVLGVARGASADEIKKGYRQKAKEQEAVMAMTAPAVDAAKTLSETPLGNGASALGAMLGTQ